MDPIASVLAALAGGPLQHDRLLRLHTPLGPEVLVAETLDGVESVDGGGFRFELTALSVDAHLSLDQLLGEAVLLQWQTDGSNGTAGAHGNNAIQRALDSAQTLRPLHGHVARCERLGSNGGLARYRLRIEPWLAFLRQRVDSYVFQDMTVVEIVESVFADYADGAAGPGGGGRLAPAWRWALNDPAVYRKRSLTTQYEESDFAFVERLLAEEGIAYWFEHVAGASAAAGDEGPGEGESLGTHTLVLGDHPDAFAELGEVRHHRSDATERRDGVHTWNTARRWRPAQLRRASWDYKTLDVRAVEAGGGDARLVVDDDAAGPYAWPDRETGERYARQQWEALQVGAETGHGAGTWRSLRAGARFHLLGDDWAGWLGMSAGSRGCSTGENTFTCLRVHHRARNNLGADILAAAEQALGPAMTAPPALPGPWVARDDDRATSHPGIHAGSPAGERLPDTTAGSGEPGAYFYQNAFDVIPARLPYRPITVDGHGIRRHPRPTVHGTQTAIVVSDGAPLLTDRDHRIKVQFPWQRGGDAGSRLHHPAGERNAPANAAAWTWVRVAGPWAGDNWGSVLVPRKGQEVLVAFLEGDIDRPVVIGSVYSGRGNADAAHNQTGLGAGGATGNAPAWFDGNGHQSVFTGLKSQQLADSQGGTGGYQQLRLDDTPGQGRVEASTTQFTSGLTLGHLKGGQDNDRGADRGFGFELATQASGALRAGAGLLLTTERGRQQLGADGALQQLQQSEQLLQSLHDAAHAQTATLPDDPRALLAQQSLQTLQETLQATQAGTAPGDGIGGGEGEAPGWSSPAIMASSPQGIVSVTPADQVWVSGTQTVLTAGQDLQWMSQGETVAAVAGGVMLYAHGSDAPKGKPNQERGIALHAAQRGMSARAHKHRARAAALTQVTLASTKADVTIAAASHVLATAAGAYIRLKDGDIELGAPGKIEWNGARKEWAGPQYSSLTLPALPRSEWSHLTSLRFALEGNDGLVDQMGWTGEPFRITDNTDTELASGVIQSDGRLPRVESDRAHEVRLVVGTGKWLLEPVSTGQGGDPAEVGDDEAHETEALAPNGPYAKVIDEHDDDLLPLDVIIPLMQMGPT